MLTWLDKDLLTCFPKCQTISKHYIIYTHIPTLALPARMHLCLKLHCQVTWYPPSPQTRISNKSETQSRFSARFIIFTINRHDHFNRRERSSHILFIVIQMRGFMPKFWLTEQMLHMLTWVESSLDQLSAYSLLMFSLNRSKIGPIFVSRNKSRKGNNQWDCGLTTGRREVNESGLGREYDFFSHDRSKFETHCMLNY